MEPKKLTWLTDLGNTAAIQKKFDAQRLKKEALFAKVAADREQQTGALIQGVNQQMTTGKKGSGQTQDTLDYGSHKQTSEFDLDEQKDDFRLVGKDGKIEEWDPETGTQEQFEKHLKAGRIVDQMAGQLELAMDDELDEKGDPVMIDDLDEHGKQVLDEHGKPKQKAKQKRLFSDEEIASEVYDPLKRRGLIPETNIPDKFSRTQEMLTGSFDGYAERLKKEGTKSKFSENFGLARTMFTSTLSVAGSVVQMDWAKGQSGSDLQSSSSPADNIKQMGQNLGLQKMDGGGWANALDKTNAIMGFCGQGMDLMNTAVDATGDIGEAIKDEPGSKRKAAAPKLAGMLIASAASSLGAELNAVGLGIAASSAYGAVVKSGPIAKELGEEELGDEQIESVVKHLASGYKAVLSKIDPKDGGSTAIMNTAAGTLKTQFEGAIKVAAVTKLLKEDKFDQAVNLFATAATTAAKAGITVDVTGLFATKEKSLAAQGAVGDLLDEEFKKSEAENGPPPKRVTEHKNDPRAKDKHEPDWMQFGKEWICTTCQAKDADAETFAGIIERKIAILKRDQAILKWGATIGGMAFSVAANFIAPMAIGGAALKMLQNLYAAVKRGQDFVAFAEKQSGMFNAASAFSSPVDQFMHNSGQQALHYSINAATEAIKMIGAICQCGAVSAAAGVALSATANIAEAVEAVLYEAKKRYDLEGAWTTYKVALSRPENRKLGLIALEKNPTLAKYAMAWGAVIKKDALVGDFMRVCGLNAESLKDPEANVHKVVSYLEARLPDDTVVVGRDVATSVPVDWAPAKIELTVACWAGAKARGETKGGVAPDVTREVESALGKIEKEWAKWETAAGKKPTELTTAERKICVSALNSASTFIYSYKPKNAEGKVHNDMMIVTAKFADLVNAKLKIAYAWEVSDPA